jgi:hypothetical protein
VTTRAAPRLGRELRAVIMLADDGASAAEICRRVGDAAERLGLVRPSYEQVRVIVNEQRRRPDAASRVSGGKLLMDIWLRTRPAWDVEPWLTGERLPNRPGAHNEPRS